MSYINQTREEAIATVQEMLADYGLTISERELIDWDIRGGETNTQLQEWVNDYVSELHTERCAARHEASFFNSYYGY